MPTINGTMKTFKVTDENGNVYVMIPVDTAARTAAANASALATRLNVDSVKYKNIVSDPNLDVYNPESTYAAGTSFCYYENELYECNTDISTPEAWNAEHWTKIIVKDLIDAAKAVADEAANTIAEAKDLEFDPDYFTSALSPDNKTVNVQLNGVPIGIDDDSPLKFVQDNAQGIVFGSDAPFSTAIAPEYDATATYAVGDHCMHLGKYYECNTAISTPEVWNSAHWVETNITKNNIKEYDYVPLSKYANYFSVHMKNLKSSNNRIIQLEGSVHITQNVSPRYDPSDGDHSSSAWPLLFYFENVDYLQSSSNQTALFINSNGTKILLIVVEFEPLKRKVYIRTNATEIAADYYHLIGTFIS